MQLVVRRLGQCELQLQVQARFLFTRRYLQRLQLSCPYSSYTTHSTRSSSGSSCHARRACCPCNSCRSACRCACLFGSWLLLKRFQVMYHMVRYF